MFVIRNEQMEVFQEESYQQFVEETVVNMRTDYPEKK
jgi:hypothetical protein